MKPEQDNLQKIIAQAAIPEEWRTILQETAKSVMNRSDSVLDEIRNRALQEADDLNFDWGKKWRVTTALVPADETSNLSGFQNILCNRNAAADEDPLGVPQFIEIGGDYFLDCSYEDALDICFDEYSEYPYQGTACVQGVDTPFRYRLVFDCRYVDFEKMLFDVSDIYKIRIPVVFSPYSRRAVKIQIPNEYGNVADVLKESNDLTPYCLDDNKLTGKLVANQQLMWNIRTQSVDLPECDMDNSYCAPYRNGIAYRYEFKELKENEFICPSRADIPNILSAQITRQEDEQRQMITFVSDKQLTEKCTSLRIMNPKENVMSRTFSNLGKDKYAMLDTERMRTRGDMERILYGLSMSGNDYDFSCCFECVSDVEKRDVDVIKTYYRDLTYGRHDNSHEQFFYKSRRKLPFCYLKFTCGDNKFLNDYASFVISFLTARYPEFQWVGVK